MRVFIILIAFLTFTISVNAQSPVQTLRGQLSDLNRNHLLSGVTVQLDYPGKTLYTVSDSLGRFRFLQVPVGRCELSFSLAGYLPLQLSQVEMVSGHETNLDIQLTERVVVLASVTIPSGKNKLKPNEETALSSARLLSTDEAFRYAGTRSDPSRMAQNFAGVSGINDARNDIIIRGNSPSGVLWRMEGIDIPNPSHFSSLGATGGPVSMLNINVLKNSDFMTGAFPARYGNALSGVFDLKLRNGNNEKTEWLGQMGFNGFELGVEGPFSKKHQSSYLVNYRYSMVASLQKLGMDVGTGASTPYYQDGSFKLHFQPTKKNSIDLFGLTGESHIHFKPEDGGDNNLYTGTDGSPKDRRYKSVTSITGLNWNRIYTNKLSTRFHFLNSYVKIRGTERQAENNGNLRDVFTMLNEQVKLNTGMSLKYVFSSKNVLTGGILSELTHLNLDQKAILNGQNQLSTITNESGFMGVLRGYINIQNRPSDKTILNAGLYSQSTTLNDQITLEPRINIRWTTGKRSAFTAGTGIHSQLLPVEMYYQRLERNGKTLYKNRSVDMTRAFHVVTGYELTVTRLLRIKAEAYYQHLFKAAVDSLPGSFSMLNSGADFVQPYKPNLIAAGKGENYGLELTIEKLLSRKYYFLGTISLFSSRYRASDLKWRNTAFNGKYVFNLLAGKEFRLSAKKSVGIDFKITAAGGQKYTPFDVAQSLQNGYVTLKEQEAYSLSNPDYNRTDLKLSFTANGKKMTQKWYVDLQNVFNRKNIYMRSLNPKSGQIATIYQMGFFPNINYQITF